MPPLNAPPPPPDANEYWRSLDQLADTPAFREFMENEYPSRAAELNSPSTRRGFLKRMGGTFALAGIIGWRWPQEKILPFARRPEGRTPGVPRKFATTMEWLGGAAPLLVTSYDGRPVKIDGNPEHPASRGAATLHAQASILEFYDPERAKFVRRRGAGQTATADWAAFETFARERFRALGATGGAGLAVLSEPSASAVFAAWRRRFQAAFPEARWYEYEPVSRDTERVGAALAFGSARRALPRPGAARVIAALDDDFLMRHPESLRLAREFAAGRRPEDGAMNRLYAIESAYTVTGSMADHRLALAPSRIPAALALLAAEVARETGANPGADLRAELERLAREDAKDEAAFVKILARDLAANRGAAILMTGPDQPPAAHALGHLINEWLGAPGQTLEFIRPPDLDRETGVDAIRALADELEAGRVETLLLLGGNPAYDAPADLDFARRIERAKERIRLSLYEDETSALCEWSLPRAHYLEAWDGVRAWDGLYSAAQPLIAPLYGGRTAAELLALLAEGAPASGLELARRVFREEILPAGADEEKAWRRALHDGFLEGSAWRPEPPPPLREAEIAEALRALPASPARDASGGLELVFLPDAKLHDGRFANNAWLQELPDPMTKLTWDNAAVVSVETARALGASDGELVALQAGQRSITLPILISPGVAPGVIVTALGYGRTAAGEVGGGAGFDTYPLRTSGAMSALGGVRVLKTGKTYALACTQDHFAIDSLGMQERTKRTATLIREASLDEFRANPEFAKGMGLLAYKPIQLFDPPVSYDGHKWGMAIDLTACIGGNACVVACQAENNIPVVGREQVRRGREMHWLRIDRYYRGPAHAPQAVHQPVLCMHCENAPCEQVCPVAATVHDHEGLNAMVYNRCIGTRYCSNNCPYKVRRFNYFRYQKRVPDTRKMQMNPEVTVRTRGVMEKCAYCTQRIQAVKIAAKNEGRPIRDGEIQTACQQTCPTRAIVFGDLNDPQSEVARLHARARAYEMLGELHTLPRTRYLARIRHPHPEAAQAHGPSGAETH